MRLLTKLLKKLEDQPTSEIQAESVRHLFVVVGVGVVVVVVVVVVVHVVVVVVVVVLVAVSDSQCLVVVVSDSQNPPHHAAAPEPLRDGPLGLPGTDQRPRGPLPAALYPRQASGCAGRTCRGGLIRTLTPPTGSVPLASRCRRARRRPGLPRLPDRPAPTGCDRGG